MVIGLQLFAAVVLIAFNALYVFHEFAFVTLRPGQLRKIEAEGSFTGKWIVKAAHQLDHYIAVDQLGITVSSIAVGWIGQPALAELFRLVLGDIDLVAGVASAASFAIAFTLITGSQMVAGELMPKTIALRHAERIARLVVLPVEATAWVFHPLVLVLNGAGRILVRLLGFEPAEESDAQVMAPDDLIAVAEISAHAGVLATDPAALKRLLNFSDLQAQDLMVPRQEVVFLSSQSSLEQVLETARSARHTRLPVYEESQDDVVGMLNVKNLVKIGPNGDPELERRWQRLVQPIPVVPEIASIEQLLRELRRSRKEMALLADEYGGTAGIVTADDIARSVVGSDDSESGETSAASGRTMAHQEDGSILIDGRFRLIEWDESVGGSLNEDDLAEVETVNGLLMYHLGRIPEVGDWIDIDGRDLIVEEMDGRQVTVARLLPEGHERSHNEALS